MSLFPVRKDQENKDLEISRDGQARGTTACPSGFYRSEQEVGGRVKLGKVVQGQPRGCAAV